MADEHKPQTVEGLSFKEFGGLTTLATTISNRVNVHFSAMVGAIARDFAKTYPEMEAAADRLADLGWTFPMLVTPRTLVELADRKWSDADVETMLSSFYTDVDFEQLRIIERDMMAAPSLARWKGLLAEAFDNLYQGRFQIPVPALLAIIEGSVADESGSFRADVVRVRQMAANLEIQQQPQSFDRLIWRSVNRWVDHLFGKAPFSAAQPAMLNRHWILHGRDAGPWAQVDVVRLLVGLHTLIS